MKFGDLRGDKVIPFYCKNCGYIELYNEKNLSRNKSKAYEFLF